MTFCPDQWDQADRDAYEDARAEFGSGRSRCNDCTDGLCGAMDCRRCWGPAADECDDDEREAA